MIEAIFHILPQYIFRRSNPLIAGIIIEYGIIRKGSKVKNDDGKEIGQIAWIKNDNVEIDHAHGGETIAICIPTAILGRNIQEEDKLYVFKEEPVKLPLKPTKD